MIFVFLASSAILIYVYSVSYKHKSGGDMDSVFEVTDKINLDNSSTSTGVTELTIKTSTILNILTFGDSLTAGWYEHGSKYHPYSIELEHLIDLKFKQEKINKHVEINQKGRSGERTEHMRGRLSQILHTNTNDIFNIICILGGTNDLSEYKSKQAIEIFNNLKYLYEMSIESNPNIQLVVISIPQSGVVVPQYMELRTQVNILIQDYVNKYNQKIDSNASTTINSNITTTTTTDTTSTTNTTTTSIKPMIYVDIEHLLPYNNINTNTMDTTHWDDTLHMTPTGYDLFGRIVYEHIEARL